MASYCRFQNEAQNPMGVRPHIPAEGRRLYSSVVQPQRVLQRAPQSTENPEPTAAAPQPLIDFSAGLQATPSLVHVLSSHTTLR